MESITTAIKPQQITSVRVRDLLAKAKEHMLKWNIEQGNEMPDGNKHKQPYKCTNINTGEVLIFNTEKEGIEYFKVKSRFSAYVVKNMLLRGQWKVERI